MTLLEIENLNVHHGLLHAVRGLSLSLDEGETTALVGANGAGKSTLLRAIAGSGPRPDGTIRFADEDLAGVAGHDRVGRGISLVPEGRRLFRAMTVEENLLLGGRHGRSGDWNLESVIDAFPKLATLRREKAGNLSGGEQQATAIGRGLMCNPRLLLLDEVSLGLSPAAVDGLYGSLTRVMSQGTAVILVEQDLRRAMDVASRVVCLLEGTKVLEGEPAGLGRERVTEAYFGHGRPSEVVA